MEEKNHIYPIFDRMLTRKDKEELLGQHSVMVWFTGLSGSGKSTIAIALERELHKRGLLCRILDGDNIRSGRSLNCFWTAASLPLRLLSVRIMISVKWRQTSSEKMIFWRFLSARLWRNVNDVMSRGCMRRRVRGKSRILREFLLLLKCRLIRRCRSILPN